MKKVSKMVKRRNVKISTKKGDTSKTHISLEELMRAVDPRIAQRIDRSIFYDFGLTKEEKESLIKSTTELYHSENAHFMSSTVNAYHRRGVFIETSTILRALLSERGFSPGLASKLSHTLIKEWYSLDASSETEQILASFGLLNEFLAQDEIETVGEFFDDNWDSILTEAFKLNFTIHSHSAELLEDLNRNSLLLIRPGNTKSEQAILEGLTKAEVSYVLKNHKGSYSMPSNKDAPALLRNAISEMKGEVETGITVESVINHFYRIYSTKLSSLRLESSLSPMEIWASFNEFMQSNRHAITKEKTKATRSVIYTNRIKNYLKIIEKFSDKLTESELFMALFISIDSKMVSRTGTLDDTITLLEDIIEKYKDDEETLFEVIRVMAQGAGFRKYALPSMTQWREALNNGSFDGIIDMDFFYMIVSETEKKRPENERLMSFRNAFKGNRL